MAAINAISDWARVVLLTAIMIVIMTLTGVLMVVVWTSVFVHDVVVGGLNAISKVV